MGRGGRKRSLTYTPTPRKVACMTNPTAAILIIGNEILSGRTPDANINYIARKVDEIGVSLREVRVVRDEEKAIIAALTALKNENTYVFTTGGIGPTHDDITTACVAKTFGLKLEQHDPTARQMKEKMGERFTPASLRMAQFPQGANLIPYAASFVPLCQVENVFIMAGIPKIMQSMLDAVLPLLKNGLRVFSKALDVLGTEGQISTPFEDIQHRFPQLDLGSYPFRVDGKPGTSLVVRGTDEHAVAEAFRAVESMVDALGLRVRG